MDLVDAIARIGFPATVAAFFVWWTTAQLSKRMDDLIDHLNQNTNAVVMLATVLAKEKDIDLDEVRDIIGGK